MKRILDWWKNLHLRCRMEIIGWSPFGNPIERCTVCHRCTVTYGSIDPIPTEISEEQALELVQ